MVAREQNKSPFLARQKCIYYSLMVHTNSRNQTRPTGSVGGREGEGREEKTEVMWVGHQRGVELQVGW